MASEIFEAMEATIVYLSFTNFCDECWNDFQLVFGGNQVNEYSGIWTQLLATLEYVFLLHHIFMNVFRQSNWMWKLLCSCTVRLRLLWVDGHFCKPNTLRIEVPWDRFESNSNIILLIWGYPSAKAFIELFNQIWLNGLFRQFRLASYL